MRRLSHIKFNCKCQVLSHTHIRSVPRTMRQLNFDIPREHWTNRFIRILISKMYITAVDCWVSLSVRMTSWQSTLSPQQTHMVLNSFDAFSTFEFMYPLCMQCAYQWINVLLDKITLYILDGIYVRGQDSEQRELWNQWKWGTILKRLNREKSVQLSISIWQYFRVIDLKFTAKFVTFGTFQFENQTAIKIWKIRKSGLV